jgi:hypothetical protein
MGLALNERLRLPNLPRRTQKQKKSETTKQKVNIMVAIEKGIVLESFFMV